MELEVELEVEQEVGEVGEVATSAQSSTRRSALERRGGGEVYPAELSSSLKPAARCARCPPASPQSALLEQVARVGAGGK